MAVIFRVGPVYAGMALPVQWHIDGATQGVAVAQISVGGNVFWTSPPTAVPMSTLQNALVPPPAAAAVAMQLYGLVAADKSAHIDVTVTSRQGGVSVESADVDFACLQPIPVLECHTPVSPGAPISVNWDLDASLSAELETSFPTFAPTDVEVDVQLFIPTAGGNVMIHEVTGITLTFGLFTRQFQALSFAVDPPNASIAYQLGLHDIVIAIHLTSGGYQNTYTADSGYAVLAESPSSGSWQWSLPAGGAIFTPPLPPPGNNPFLKVTIGWNTPYTVGGRFVSQFSNTVVKGEVSLQVTDAWEEPPPLTGPLTFLGTATTSFLAPGEDDPSGDVSFPGQNQDYTWLDEATGIFSQGTVKRELTYFADITVIDAFQNVYGSFRSSGYSVDGSVPDPKLNAAITARAEFAVAIFLAAAGAAGGIFGGIATALSALFYVEFQQNINNAKDPPKKNPLYRKQVRIRPTRLNRTLLAAPGIRSVREFVLRLTRISAAQKALSQIAGRYLGARAAQDGPAMQLQVSSHAALLESLRGWQAGLPALALRASQEMNRLIPQRSRRHPARSVIRLVQQGGLTPSIRVALRKSGLTPQQLRAIAKALRTAGIGPWLSLGLGGIAREHDKSHHLFATLAESASELTSAILKEAKNDLL